MVIKIINHHASIIETRQEALIKVEEFRWNNPCEKRCTWLPISSREDGIGVRSTLKEGNAWEVEKWKRNGFGNRVHVGACEVDVRWRRAFYISYSKVGLEHFLTLSTEWRRALCSDWKITKEPAFKQANFLAYKPSRSSSVLDAKAKTQSLRILDSYLKFDQPHGTIPNPTSESSLDHHPSTVQLLIPLDSQITFHDDDPGSIHNAKINSPH